MRIKRFKKELKVEGGAQDWLSKLKGIEERNMEDITKWVMTNNAVVLTIIPEILSSRDWSGSEITIVYE